MNHAIALIVVGIAFIGPAVAASGDAKRSLDTAVFRDPRPSAPAARRGRIGYPEVTGSIVRPSAEPETRPLDRPFSKGPPSWK